MKKFVLSVLALLTCSAIFAADLDTYKATYQKEMETIILEHGMNISKLNESYSQALNGLSDRATNAGDLKTVKSIMAETERFASDKTVTPDNTKDSSPDLKNIQLSYIQNLQYLTTGKANKVIALVSKYDSALNNLQISMTKEKKLNDATAVMEERERVAKSEEVVSAKGVVSSAQEKLPKDVSKTPIAKETDKTIVSEPNNESIIEDEIGDALGNAEQDMASDIKKVTIKRKASDRIEVICEMVGDLKNRPNTNWRLHLFLDLDKNEDTGRKQNNAGIDFDIVTWTANNKANWGVNIFPIGDYADKSPLTAAASEKKNVLTVALKSKHFADLDSFNIVCQTVVKEVYADTAPDSGYKEVSLKK